MAARAYLRVLDGTTIAADEAAMEGAKMESPALRVIALVSVSDIDQRTCSDVWDGLRELKKLRRLVSFGRAESLN